MGVHRVDPPSVPAPPGPFSHVADAGGIVLFSGQTARTSSNSMPEGAVAQTIGALDAIEALLADVGLGPEDVLGFRIYVVGREHLAGFQEGRRVVFERWYGSGPHPTSTIAFVTGLVDDRAVVEIEATAARTGERGSARSIL